MHILAIFFYLTLLILVGIGSRLKHQTANDFILGSRKMNFWVTALAAHASDMSSWIFMGYPAVLYATGLFNGWLAIGLTVFMFLNWQFVAPALRRTTEQYNSLTLPSFFESRFQDTSGVLRILTVLASLIYYTIYISALLLSLGLLIHTLFDVHYILGLVIGLCIVVPYLFIGGYVTLAWTDFFQGLFLMVVIVTVPLYAWYHVGGWPSVQAAIGAKATYRGLVPTTSWKTALEALLLFSGWGLGYFGMPHVLTKFMGIEHVEELSKSKWVGISWQSLSLLGSTFIGLIGIALFTHLTDDQLVFVNMVTLLFSPFTAAFILCAILGATITAMDSQILVLASNVTEDLYKKVLRKGASSDELILVSRLAIFCIACIAGLIAATTANTIFKIVSYAWFGLGSTFGPLILFSLYYKPTTRGAAISGILIGAFVAGFWPLTDNILPISIPSIIPGFFLSSFTIWLVSFISHRKRGVINEQT